MPDCEKYLDLISAELDGELTETERSALYTHLEICENCRRYHSAVSGIHAVLAEELYQPPVDLTAKVMASIPQAKPAAKKPTLIRNMRPLRGAVLAAVAVFAIWTGVKIFSPKGTAEMEPMAAPAAADTASVWEAVPAEMAPDMEYGVVNAGTGAAYNGPAEVREIPVAEESNMSTYAADKFAAEPETMKEDMAEDSCRAFVRAEIYRNGQNLLATEDAGMLEQLDRILFAADSKTDIPTAEADYSVRFADAAGEQMCVTVWFCEDGLCCLPDGGESAWIALASPEEFLQLIT